MLGELIEKAAWTLPVVDGAPFKSSSFDVNQQPMIGITS